MRGRRSEDDLIGPRSDRSRDHFPRLVQRLSGEPTRTVQPRRITPAGLLRIEPSPTCIRQHRLTRRTVQEDLGNGIGHASKLARCGCRANHQKRNARTVIGACSYVRVNIKTRVVARRMGKHRYSVCTDPTKGTTWVAGLNGPLGTI